MSQLQLASLALGLSLAASAALTLAVRGFALRRGWLARRRPDRWHERPTALFGGVAIFSTVVLVLPVVLLLAPGAVGATVLWLALGGLVAFGTGLADDVYDLRPATKIVLQSVAAACLIGGAEWVLPLTPRFLLDVLLTYFWVLGVINAVNLIDGLDGLAAGVVAIAAAWMAGLLLLQQVPAPLLVLVLCVLVGALLGFLLHNYSPASIFMGDSGSLFIGYAVAVLSVGATNALLPAGIPGAPLLAILAPALFPAAVLAVPLFDTVLVTLMRTWHGRAVSAGGTDHSHYRMAALGLTERSVVHSMYMLGVLGGAVGAVVLLLPGWGLVAAGLYALLLVFLGVYLTRTAPYGAEAGAAHSGVWWRQLFETLFLRHQLAAVVADVLLIGSSYYAAWVLRFEGDYLGPVAQRYGATLPVVIPLTLVILYASGVYRPVWRVLSLMDLRHYVVAGLVLPFGVWAYLAWSDHLISYSVALIYDLLLLALMLGSRLFFRFLDGLVHRLPSGIEARRVLVYGAGYKCRVALEQLGTRRNAGVHVVGLIDDDPHLQGRYVWGRRVLGGCEDVPRLVRQHAVTEMLISTEKVDAVRLQTLLNREELGVAVYRLSLGWQPLAGPTPEQAVSDA